MQRISTLLVAIAAALLFTTRADAAPINLTVGETLTFNWDLTLQGATPAPPYTSETFFSNYIPLAPGTALSAMFFQQLNALGAGISGGTGSATFSGFAGFDDGVFSATYTLLSGAATIDPVVVARLGTDSTARIAPLAAVPEPASLLLLGSGLAGVAVRARRRSQQQRA